MFASLRSERSVKARTRTRMGWSFRHAGGTPAIASSPSLRATSRGLLAIAAVLGLQLAGIGTAQAFCRSTTCRATASQDCETDFDGCPVTGEALWWPTRCVSYAMNERGTLQLDRGDTRKVIAKAFQAWSDVPCPDGGRATMTFEERDPVACKKSEYNKNGKNLNVVLFQDDYWNYRGIDGTLAKTSVTYSDKTGEIYDADIEVNAALTTISITDNPKKVDYDLQSILTHEVGHFIGIAHAPDPDTVMYASYSESSIGQRALAADDIDAVCAIYPPDADTFCNLEPKGGFSATCDDEDDASCAVGQVGARDRAGTNGGLPHDARTSGMTLVGLGMLFVVGSSRRALNHWRNR